jgi:hypothetical protein
VFVTDMFCKWCEMADFKNNKRGKQQVWTVDDDVFYLFLQTMARGVTGPMRMRSPSRITRAR